MKRTTHPTDAVTCFDSNRRLSSYTKIAHLLIRRPNRRAFTQPAFPGLESLEPRQLLSGTLLINEFAAINATGLADGDGAISEWIEIKNLSNTPVNLDGWHLTDDANDLTKWTFHNGIVIQNDGFDIVFATGQETDNYIDAGGNLHTNFRLDGDGEYLALVQPDGVTIEHEYAPEFPRQLEDFSYGIVGTAVVGQTLVDDSTNLTYLVPQNDSLGTNWTQPDFDDDLWNAAETGLGFDTQIGTPPFESKINFQPADADLPDGYLPDAGQTFGPKPGNVSYGWDAPVTEVHDRDAGAVGGALSDLVAWWKFDESTGTLAADSSGSENQHDATLMDGARFFPTVGKFGGSVLLTGTSAFVQAADHADLEFAAEQSFSISFWFRGSASPEADNQGLITKGYADTTRNTDGYYLIQSNGGTANPGFDSRQGAGTTPRVQTSNTSGTLDATFHHVVMVRDSVANEIRMYYDNGEPSVHLMGPDANNGDWDMGVNNDPFVIGNHFNRFTTGFFDDVAVFRGAISESEIDTIFNGGIEALNTSDQRLDTLAEMQTTDDRTWEIAVPNGPYIVTASFGDPSNATSINNIDIEGVVTNDPDGADSFDEYTVAVNVTDGRLTISPAPGAVDAKIQYVDIASTNTTTFVGQIESNLEADLLNISPSLYTRIPFDVADPSSINTLTLDMKYDDGFIAYLNGVEIASRNAPESPTFDSTATSTRPDSQAILSENIDVTQHKDLLVAGENLLAIHALNITADDDDFLLIPSLLGDATVSNQASYFDAPTPNAANNTNSLGVIKDTKFSIDRGFFYNPFQVEITTATPDAEIRYTLDGTAPTPTTGIIYSGPIDITTTTTLRAAAFKPGFVATNVDTQTYIFPEDVLQQNGSGLPPFAGWGHSGPDWAIDPDIVNNPAYSDNILDDLRAVPTVSLVMDWDDMFGSGGQGIYISGKNVERPVSAEYINPDGTTEFQVNAGVEIQGGSSTNRWKDDKLSMQLVFKDIYGPGKLETSIFDDQGGAGIYNTLILDATLNLGFLHPDHGQRVRGQYIRDQFMADAQLAMGGQSFRGNFVHLYINGLYWGQYGIHERPDEDFAASYYGGEDEQYQIYKHTSGNVVNNAAPGHNCSGCSYGNLHSIANSGLASDSQYQLIQQHLDIDDFIDYMLINFYGGNTDWPHHNWYASRNFHDPEGLWRFHSWDAEHVLKGLNDNETGENDNGTPGSLHQALRQNAEYRIRFADAVHQHMFNDGLLTPDNAAALYSQRLTEIDQSIVMESARWGDNRRANDPYERDVEWANERDWLLNTYFPQRTNNVLNQLRNVGLYPNVDAPSFNQHGGLISSGFDLQMTNENGSGTLYYTLDGSDPRIPADAPTEVTTIVPENAAKKVLVPSSLISNNWRGGGAFDDSSWHSGTGGIGYDENTTYDALISPDFNLEGAHPQRMHDVRTTMYARIPFNLTAQQIAGFDFMNLKVRYDDGFVAFLNGVQIEAENEPGSLTWTSEATGGHSDSAAVDFVTFDVSAHLGSLEEGENILAFHGLNDGLTSSDFLLSAELEAGEGAVTGINPNAVIYDGSPINLTDNATVRARILDGSTWSAANVATFAIADSPLRITELMYNPADPTNSELTIDPTLGNDDFEYIEIRNTGDSAINIEGFHFTDGIEFTVPQGTTLAPSETALIVRDAAAFDVRYDTNALRIIGEFEDGNLSNGGEILHLVDALGNTIHEFEYDDGRKWPIEADGHGASIEVIDTEGDYSDADNWRASFESSGTPGFTGSGAQTNIFLVPRLNASTTQTSTTLPLTDLPNVPGGEPDDFYIREGADYFVEIWAKADQLTGLAGPIAGGSLTLEFDPEIATAISIDFGQHFTDNQSQNIDLIEGEATFAADTLSTDLGDDEHVLFARVLFNSQNNIGPVNEIFNPVDTDLDREAVPYAFTLLNLGPVPTNFEVKTPDIDSRAVIFDFDNNNIVNFADLAFFLPALGEIPGGSQPPFATWADFNNDNTVDADDRQLLLDAFAKPFGQISIPDNARTEFTPPPPGGPGGVDLLAGASAI